MEIPRPCKRIYTKCKSVVEDLQSIDFGRALYRLPGELFIQVVIYEIYTPDSACDNWDGEVILVIGQSDTIDRILDGTSHGREGVLELLNAQKC